MSESDLELIGLPKWPALLVTGRRVTPDQAAEVIVRTHRWPLSTNAHEWSRAVQKAVGYPDDYYGTHIGDTEWRRRDEELKAMSAGARGDYFRSLDDAQERFRSELGVLTIEYLHNAWIASSWIGGPHGWCDWSGKIGCDNYNIGKWPNALHVLQEWQRIAAAFPFLNLDCQLLDRERGDDGPHIPLVEYAVTEGEASWIQPTELLRPVCSDVPYRAMGTDYADEIGCSVEQVLRGVELARARSKR